MQSNQVTAAVQAAYPPVEPAAGISRSNWQDAPPPIFTVAQFAERNPAFTQAALRNLIFKAEERQSTKGVIVGNGLLEAGAIIRHGRKVMLHEQRFFDWLDSQNEVRN